MGGLRQRKVPPWQESVATRVIEYEKIRTVVMPQMCIINAGL